MDQPPAAAFTAFADMWPRATETDIGATLCAIAAGRTSTFFDTSIINFCRFLVYVVFVLSLSRSSSNVDSESLHRILNARLCVLSISLWAVLLQNSHISGQ